jgi:hypothetical protein
VIASVVEAVAAHQSVDPGALSYEVYNGGNFLTVTALADGDPLVVCRVPRSSTGPLWREYDNLRRLEELVAGNETLSRTTEEVVTVLDVEETPILVKQFLPGFKGGDLPRTMSAVGDFLEVSTRWLAEFSTATERHRVYAPAAKRRRTRELVGRADLRDVRRFVGDGDLFVAPMHGDFAPGNVLLDGSGELTGVVDFEWFAPEGVPVFDFVHLAMTTGLLVHGSTGSTVEAVLFADNTFTRAVARCAPFYRDRLGISASSLRTALPLCARIGLNYGHAPTPVVRELLVALRERPDEVVWV